MSSYKRNSGGGWGRLGMIPLAWLPRSNFVTCHYSEPGINMTDGACVLNADSPRCSKHNRLCALRIVRKDGDNKGRRFYACSLPREAQCGFFQVCMRFFQLTLVQLKTTVIKM